ncbi:MAG: DUF5667 domain-containing protein [Anaerolineae bacterium]
MSNNLEDKLNVEREQAPVDPYAPLADEIVRVFMEESPRMAPAVQSRQLAALRARAAEKRAERKPSRWGWLAPVPRWAQVAAIALVVVLLANGISVASASSLPGSPLYPVKRLTEQSNVLMSPTAGDRARLWMSLASRRLDEAQYLVSHGQRVDDATLDAIDESIARTLGEIASTHGTERLTLLKMLVELAVRQQGILDGMAAQAAEPADRARLEQSARFLEGVGSLAGDAQNSPATPLIMPTSTLTSSPTATSTSTATRTVTATAEPTDAPKPSATETAQPTALPPAPTHAPAPQTGEPGDHNATATPGDKPENQPTAEPTNKPENQSTAEPTEKPGNQQTPEPTEKPGNQQTPGPTENPGRTATEAPNGGQSPTPARTGTPDN